VLDLFDQGVELKRFQQRAAMLRDLGLEPGAARMERRTQRDLAAVIGRRVPATSQHLRVLRELGLVSARRSGSQVYYSLRRGAATEQVRAVLSAVQRPLSATG
jgi:ArsR family transcriptional regulator